MAKKPKKPAKKSPVGAKPAMPFDPAVFGKKTAVKGKPKKKGAKK